MLKDLFLSLPENIFTKINYLKQDYVGLSMNFDVLINFTLGFIISVSFLTISLLIGQKIRKFFFKKTPNGIDYLTDIALGTILIGTGISLLGVFSLLNSFALLSFLIILLIFSLYKFQPNYLHNARKKLLFNLKLLKQNKLVFLWLLLFIILALVNLINPEIREDQYHVDIPNVFLNSQTTLIPPNQAPYAPLPMLSEMMYLIGIFLWSNESARYIHFMFYILVLLTLIEFSKLKNYKFSIYAPLLFATAPVVIHETSSMYVDFQWIFFFLLSIFLLIRKKLITYQTVLLSGIFLGAMMASKIWTIVFFPLSVVYLIIVLNNIDKKLLSKYIIVLFLSTLSISFIWYFRAYLLTGNALYPAFTNNSLKISFFSTILNYIHINYPILNPVSYLNVYSPLFFSGCILFFYKLKNNIILFIKLNIFKYFLLLLVLYLFINYPYGRYLLGLYILFIFFASIGINTFVSNFKYSKLILNTLLFILFSYYFINSALVLPYSFKIADKNNYISRILIRDNSSYYDFGKKFDKYIKKDDLVATYRIYGHYYANFNYQDTNFIFDNNKKSFDMLKKNKYTKLFIRGGDINWFCKESELINCNSSKYYLLSSHQEFPTYYLYGIK